MWYDKYFAALPSNEKNLLQSYFEKLEKGLTLPRQEADKAYKAMTKLSQAINDSNFIERFAKILGTAFQLTPQEITCLKGMMQSSRNITSFTKDEEYLAIIKIAKTLTIYSNQFRTRPSLNTLFNQLNNDTAFKSILGIIKSIPLSDALAVEFVKIQYKPNYAGSSRTNELIKQLDNGGKLSSLPEKAFNQLMNYRVKMLKLEKTDASILMKIEKNQTLTEAEKMQLHQRLANNQQSINELPKKAQAVIKAQDVATHAGVKDFLTKTKDVRFSQAIANDMASYIKLLNDIENNKQPDNNMLKKLDLLHDELKRHNKLGALPNRSQAFLENYQTEQYLKQKAPQNAQKLLEDLKNNKTLTVFQAFYLSIKLPKKLANMRNAPTFDTILAKQLKELSQDVRDKAAEARELIDSKALNEIDAVIEQIRRESHQLKEEGVKIPELGNATVKQTSNFMEFRFEDVTKMRGILTEKLKDSKSDFYKLLTDPNDSFWQNLTFRTHKGEDYSAYGHNGIITYQYGFKEKPEIAKVFYIDHKPTTYNRILKVHVKTKDITILEYHPKYGALLTTFRHLQKLYKEQVNQNLIQGAVLGTYRMHDNDALSPEQKLEIPTDMNEHVHIERREAEPKDFKKFLNDDGSIKLKQFTAQANSATKLVRSTIDGNDYHAIALFTPNSALNKQLLANIKTDWQNYNDHLVKAGTFKLPADADKEDIKKVIELIMNYLLDASLRDQLTLETIVKMLLRIKILLSQIGEKNQHLEKIIQSAQRTAIDLREKKVDGRFKIIIS